MDYEKKYNEALEKAKKYHKEYWQVDAKDITETLFPELREKPLTSFQQCLNSILLKVYYASVPGKVDKFILDIIKNRTDELVELAKRHEYTDCQLRESEDEWIRKFLITITENLSAPNFEEVDRKRVLAWLEKQKEQKPDIELIQQTWYMEGYQDREHNLEPEWIVKTGEDGPKYKPNLKYGQSLVKEQKPADDKAFEEWIDDWWKHNKVNNPDSYDKGDEIQFDERGFKNFCRGIRNMYQQKQEWSKEDEYCKQQLIAFCENCMQQDANAIRCANWLKSLRPQPKAEWSEEEKTIIEGACNALEIYGHSKLASRLKSLHLQSHWKPSEEQMKALQSARFLYRDGLENSATASALESLYLDLKKL